MKQSDRVIKPYIHDCKTCKWAGWHTEGEVYYNVYLCEPKQGERTILFRYGNEPHEYRSLPVDMLVKGNLDVYHSRTSGPKELSRAEAERAIKTLRPVLGGEWADRALELCGAAESHQEPHGAHSGQGVLFNDDGSPFDLIPDDTWDPLSSYNHYR